MNAVFNKSLLNKVQLWKLSAVFSKLINFLEFIQFLIRITGLTWRDRVRNTRFREMVGVVPTRKEIDWAQLRLLGRVERLDYERVDKRNMDVEDRQSKTSRTTQVEVEYFTTGEFTTRWKSYFGTVKNEWSATQQRRMGKEVGSTDREQSQPGSQIMYVFHFSNNNFI